MLYPKNTESELSRELFRDPTSEYRAAPFWAWNCELEQDELFRQMDIFRKMGFGGAHMHVRTGMATKYLSDEHMALIRACTEKAKRDGQRSYLYDEDRWPSGAAGGYVTRDKAFRARHLFFAPAEMKPDTESRLIARYDICLNTDGYLTGSRVLAEGEKAAGEEWDAYIALEHESGWYNDQTYVDTLNPAAIRKFIDITYTAYDRTVSEEFGKVVPSIFTDEPQFSRKSTLFYGTDKKAVVLPWTDDLADTFREAYGEDLIQGIPALIWDSADGTVSRVRYHYHDHVCERFARAFADQCGGWCRAHGLALTGHMMEEPTLLSQTSALGEAMRSYRGFDIPGIDMLCNWYEYTTAKQAQSAVHQFGREGMLSELDGVTNWDFDFRGHKRHGDWQAALGVTLRVPHLAWVSMKGAAKRDYPASISYQSPWWMKYSMIEDHFARVNTAMTRGKPIVKVAVIHPVESYWLHFGPSDQTALRREEMEKNFSSVTEWLLFGAIDFDFISESLLPSECEKGGNPLQVGKMAYDAVVVPSCETLRATTLERLEAFADAGGKLIFAGEIPSLEDAAPSARGQELAKKCLSIPFSRGALLKALEGDRLVELRDGTGALTQNLIYQLRQDGDDRWLFIAHGGEPYNKDISKNTSLRVRVKGEWDAEIWDSMTGEVELAEEETANGRTDIYRTLYDYDSLLIRLRPARGAVSRLSRGITGADTKSLFVPDEVDYTLSEPNAALLDRAAWSLNGGAWHPEEEALRLDALARAEKGWEEREAKDVQPWAIKPEPVRDYLLLKYTFRAESDMAGLRLATEDADLVEVTLNGETVASKPDGWYVDRSIGTIPLPAVRKGENELLIKLPFGVRTYTEWCYILGDFGVRVSGRKLTLTARPEKLSFGDITRQGLPFYGGNVTYAIPLGTAGGAIELRASRYRGALIAARLDGGEEKSFPFPPYTVRWDDVPAGKHTVYLTLYGHRRNSFGPVHLADTAEKWIGPPAWHSVGEKWTYDYMLADEGILNLPVINEITE